MYYLLVLPLNGRLKLFVLWIGGNTNAKFSHKQRISCLSCNPSFWRGIVVSEVMMLHVKTTSHNYDWQAIAWADIHTFEGIAIIMFSIIEMKNLLMSKILL